MYFVMSHQGTHSCCGLFDFQFRPTHVGSVGLVVCMHMHRAPPRGAVVNGSDPVAWSNDDVDADRGERHPWLSDNSKRTNRMSSV